MTRSLCDLTSNQYWGGLNRRFQKRARRLHALGFTHEQDEKRARAYYTRKRRNKIGYESLPASILFYADNRAWFELLRDTILA